MKLHADLTQRAFVDSNNLEWIASPSGGVERRMLERDGDEVARATTIVRFAPGSSFPAHTHELGEEFLVLDGVFSDETGDFEKGMYVRNPPGSSHIPGSRTGTTILVKLRQMDPEDRHIVRVDTRDPGSWQEIGPGHSILSLFTGPEETVDMVELAPGTELKAATFPGGAEYFVLSGSFSDEAGTYQEGGWLRIPADSRQTIRSQSGVRLWRKTGHL